MNNPRDIIKEPLPDILTGDGIRHIFALYEELNNHIVSVTHEPLPEDLSGNINAPITQAKLREIFGFYVEETAEAWEVMTDIIQMVHTQKEGLELQEAIYSFNEEFIDIFHFLIRLLSYSGVTPVDFMVYYDEMLQEANLEVNLDRSSYLRTAFNQGQYTRLAMGMQGPRGLKDLRVLVDDMNPFGCGLRGVSLEWSIYYAYQDHHITAILGKAMNLLKNKPWKQTRTDTNLLLYKQYLMNAFTNFCGLASYVGFDYIELFEAYFYKNRINIQRIKNGR